MIFPAFMPNTFFFSYLLHRYLSNKSLAREVSADLPYVHMKKSTATINKKREIHKKTNLTVTRRILFFSVRSKDVVRWTSYLGDVRRLQETMLN